METLNLFIPISKVDAAKRLVYGVITEETPDKSGEIFDYESGKAAVQKWSDEFVNATGGESRGNLRAMHDNKAAGKFTNITFDDENKRIEGVAKVVDDDEWNKVLESVYTGFSIGGNYSKRWKDPGNPALQRYTPELSEVSLVDNPCVPTATFEFIKQDGSTELRKFNRKEVTMTESTGGEAANTDGAQMSLAKNEDAPTERPQDKGGVVQGFQAKDGSFHLKKADALARNDQVDAEAVAAPARDMLKKLDDAVSKAASAETKKKEDDEDEEKEGDDEETKSGKKAGKEKKAEEDADKAKKEDAKDKSEKAAGGELAKGMYAVGRLADLIQTLDYLQQCCEREEASEQDDSTVPAKLKAALSSLGDILKQMATEEVDELLAGGDQDDFPVLLMAAKSGGLSKRGAKLSAASKEHIDKMMKSASDHFDQMGKCYKDLGMAEEDEDDGDAKKTAKAAAERDALQKILGEIAPKLENVLKTVETLTRDKETLQERIDHLEKQPTPAKGTLRAVEKGNDGGNVSDGDAKKKAEELLKGMTPEEQSMVLMKAALSLPKQIMRNQ